MLDPWQDSDEAGTVFRDVILLALAGFMFMTVLMLPHLNPPGSRADAAIEPPGNVIIEARWDDNLRTDVDLWVQAPGDVPVGYSNKSGLIFNLLRDDLGSQGDPTGINFETAFSRGIPPGGYTVNVHLFRNIEAAYPVNVRVVARVKSDKDGTARPIASTTVRLDREGQEFTAFRFRLNERGELETGSVNSVFKPLRSAKAY